MSGSDARPPLPRVAVLGLRGVPATWGGVEQQCQALYTRLAAAGFPITLYCRTSYVREPLSSYRGIRLVRLPTLRGKHVEAFVHTFLCCLHLALHPQDIVHVYSQGPALFLPLLRVLCPRSRLFFTCGGLDWQRGKWSGLASRIMRLGEWCSARLTDVRIMVSRTLGDYYRTTYGVDSLSIPNGVDALPEAPLGELAGALGLTPRGYALFVGRLVPEKRIQDLIDAIKTVPGLRLVIAGGAAGSEAYVEELLRRREGSAGRAVLAGYRFGRELDALFANARCYVSASGLEGLPLSLLEAMAHGLPCLATDIPPHREVLGETGRFVPVGDVAGLARGLAELAAAPPDELAARGRACRERALRHFSWDTAAASLGQAYVRAFASRSGGSAGDV